MLSEKLGTFEAKTHFSKIIEKVENGSDFIITRRGKPIAKIIPFKQEPEITRSEAIAKLMEMRKFYRGESGSFNIRDVIKEGRF